MRHATERRVISLNGKCFASLDTYRFYHRHNNVIRARIPCANYRNTFFLKRRQRCGPIRCSEPCGISWRRYLYQPYSRRRAERSIPYQVDLNMHIKHKLPTCLPAARFGFLMYLLGGAFCAPTAVASAEVEHHRPNIILVFIDDMGWSDFSCFGNDDAKTPHIDQLAAEGIAFEQFYVNSPICSPSRVAVSTGQYPQRWRISSYLNNRRSNEQRGMANWLDVKAPMLSRSLQQSGYATGHFGKWHMGGQRNIHEAPLITEYGFDESITNFEGLGARVLPLKYSPNRKSPAPHNLGSDTLGHGPVIWHDRAYVTEKFTEAALTFAKFAGSQNQPFYLNLWPDDVHTPMHPPLEKWGDGKDRTLYLAVLETMDQQLGVIFNYVRNSKSLVHNTVILVCSDNGPEVGFGSAAPLRGHKATLYEGGIRSSLIAWAPGLMPKTAQGSRNHTSVFRLLIWFRHCCPSPAPPPRRECYLTERIWQTHYSENQKLPERSPYSFADHRIERRSGTIRHFLISLSAAASGSFTVTTTVATRNCTIWRTTCQNKSKLVASTLISSPALQRKY